MAGRTEAFLLPQEGLLRGPRSKDRAQKQRQTSENPTIPGPSWPHKPVKSCSAVCTQGDWCTQHGPAKSGMTSGKHSEKGCKMGTENE